LLKPDTGFAESGSNRDPEQNFKPTMDFKENLNKFTVGKKFAQKTSFISL
jgi:hypothetical protein